EHCPASVDCVMLAGQLRVGGIVSGVTVTVRVALLLAPWVSVTVNVKEAVEAPQSTVISALTMPIVSTEMFETVTPLTVVPAPPFTVTARLDSASSASLTVAICVLIAEAVCCSDKGLAVIVGGEFCGQVFS